jgi:catechol 2,3-dioxygenase-like lactoylglutathione lyase family enzyme
MRITGFNHVGVTVSDLDVTLEFYRAMFGLEPTFVAEGDSAELASAVGVPGARLRFAFVPVGQGIVEVLEYDNPRRTTFESRNCDVGAPHICIDVDDIDAAYEELLAKGAEFYSPPFRIDSGPLAGCAFAYLKDPDGITLEIFEQAGAAE